MVGYRYFVMNLWEETYIVVCLVQIDGNIYLDIYIL